MSLQPLSPMLSSNSSHVLCFCVAAAEKPQQQSGNFRRRVLRSMRLGLSRVDARALAAVAVVRLLLMPAASIVLVKGEISESDCNPFLPCFSRSRLHLCLVGPALTFVHFALLPSSMNVDHVPQHTPMYSCISTDKAVLYQCLLQTSAGLFAGTANGCLRKNCIASGLTSELNSAELGSRRM